MCLAKLCLKTTAMPCHASSQRASEREPQRKRDAQIVHTIIYAFGTGAHNHHKPYNYFSLVPELSYIGVDFSFLCILSALIVFCTVCAFCLATSSQRPTTMTTTTTTTTMTTTTTSCGSFVLKLYNICTHCPNFICIKIHSYIYSSRLLLLLLLLLLILPSICERKAQ